MVKVTSEAAVVLEGPTLQKELQWKEILQWKYACVCVTGPQSREGLLCRAVVDGRRPASLEG